MKLTRKQLRKIILSESFRSFPPPKEPTEIPVELRYVLEDFTYNYLTFFVEPKFKHMVHFYQSVHENTINYANNFSKYLEDSAVFEDAIDMMNEVGISTYQDQMNWIKQYFIENWELIMAKFGGQRQ